MLVYFSLLEVLNVVALFFHAVVFYHDIVRAPKKAQQLLGPQTAVGGLARLASHKAFYLGTSLLSQLLRLAGIGFNLGYSAGAGKIRRDTFVPLGAHPIVEALYATTIYLCTASIGIIWINTAVSAGLWRSARYDLTVNNQLAWLTGTAVALFLVLFIGVYKMLFWMAGREGVSSGGPTDSCTVVGGRGSAFVAALARSTSSCGSSCMLSCACRAVGADPGGVHGGGLQRGGDRHPARPHLAHRHPLPLAGGQHSQPLDGLRALRPAHRRRAAALRPCRLPEGLGGGGGVRQAPRLASRPEQQAAEPHHDDGQGGGGREAGRGAPGWGAADGEDQHAAGECGATSCLPYSGLARSNRSSSGWHLTVAPLPAASCSVTLSAQMIWRGKSKLNVLMDLTQQPDHRQRHQQQQQEQPARQSTISLDRELDGLAIIHVATTSSSNTNEIQSPSRREDYASPDRRPNAAEGGGSLLLAASVCAAGNPQQEQAATDGRHHEEAEAGAPRADAEPLMTGPNGSTAEVRQPGSQLPWYVCAVVTDEARCCCSHAAAADEAACGWPGGEHGGAAGHPVGQGLRVRHHAGSERHRLLQVGEGAASSSNVSRGRR